MSVNRHRPADGSVDSAPYARTDNPTLQNYSDEKRAFVRQDFLIPIRHWLHSEPKTFTFMQISIPMTDSLCLCANALNGFEEPGPGLPCHCYWDPPLGMLLKFSLSKFLPGLWSSELSDHDPKVKLML